VKGFGSTAIPRVAIRPVRNEEFRDRTPKCGCSHMKGRIASVKVVSDFGEKEVWCAVTCSANLGWCGGKRGIGSQTARHVVDLAVHDEPNEIKKGRLYLWHGFLIRLVIKRPPVRLSKSGVGHPSKVTSPSCSRKLCITQRTAGSFIKSRFSVKVNFRNPLIINKTLHN
jgi:hypothetical protein